ncbi:interferon-gamma-inducible GTPase 10-like isoform X2 [Ruditapes philippinarum]|uniref:interferon-gamma-inducible GTPase 10-like isoform X2 n=1 Tax=Ruditapes philippinarum TaxID=129788 RepID=UPI00295BC767|nr:interferon-gamma-inducible GTPase 10-like isoform X2 [Ruditapes philippinarum]
MASKENEHYWRLYFYLNSGVSVLSRDIIESKSDGLGQDLSSLLRKNEGKIRKNSSLNDTDLGVLFPDDGETNMLKWNANLYLCVIPAIFRDLLKPNDRIKLRLLQNALKDLWDMQDDTTLDNLRYEQHVQNLEGAFLVLAFNEDLTMKMVEMKKVYIDQPLDFFRLVRDTAKMDFPSGLEEKVAEFLKQIPSRKEIRSAVSERFENSNDSGAGASSRDVANSSDETGTVPISEEEKDAFDEIVRRATKPQTDKERRSWSQEWQKVDIESSHKQQDFEKLVTENLEKWKQEPVNIAVIGRSGAGKSRLINAIRGCTSKDDQLYANVGTTETTLEVKRYPHPHNPLLVFWDLPGIGTKKFPRKDFIENKKIAFFSYDVYLIVCADRFTEDEETFAEILEKSGKTFLFVRTKADVNEDEFENFEMELGKIRKDCVENLCSRKIKDKDVFLISSKFVDHKLLDFGKLVERLVGSLPDLKKEAILNSLQFHTKTLLKEKRAELESRLFRASVMSAFCGAWPVPTMSFSVDFDIISKELVAYRQNLCITVKYLEDIANKTEISVDDLKTKYSLKSFTLYNCMEEEGGLFSKFAKLIPTFASIAMSKGGSTIIPIPFIGSLASAGLSFYTTYRFLASALDDMVQDSETLLDILLERTGKRILHTK